jgi:hypothetical protein
MNAARERAGDPNASYPLFTTTACVHPAGLDACCQDLSPPSLPLTLPLPLPFAPWKSLVKRHTNLSLRVQLKPGAAFKKTTIPLQQRQRAVRFLYPDSSKSARARLRQCKAFIMMPSEQLLRVCMRRGGADRAGGTSQHTMDRAGSSRKIAGLAARAWQIPIKSPP